MPICLLNAGENPVIPYESFYADREPTLFGEPVFQMREYLRKQGLHKDPDYPEPEDHVAVEFDFLAEMNRREMAGDQSAAEVRIDFGRRHIAWRTEFCAVMHAADKSGFYKALAELTLGYLFVAHLVSVEQAQESMQDPARRSGGTGETPKKNAAGRRFVSAQARCDRFGTGQNHPDTLLCLRGAVRHDRQA